MMLIEIKSYFHSVLTCNLCLHIVLCNVVPPGSIIYEHLNVLDVY